MKQLATLWADQITTGYDRKIIIQEMSLTIPNHEISVIIGANACGKSTLLKTLARILKPTSGSILLGHEPLSHIPPKQLAQTIGLLSQTPHVPEGITVGDLVSRGRFPYQGFLGTLSTADHLAIDEAIAFMGLSDIVDRPLEELSGGQRQRVWIAMSLAQQTDILLLDEPTTFLDITHQIEILDLLIDLNHKKRTTIVMVLHDINLSARYATHLFALKKGKLIAQGKPNEIINESLIQEVFDLDCTVMNDPVSLTPLIIPKGRHHV